MSEVYFKKEIQFMLFYISTFNFNISGSKAVEMRMFPTLLIASFNFEKYDSF